jgi:type III pantothenate kinase
MMQVLVLDIGNSDAVLATFINGEIKSTFRWNSKDNNTLEKVVSQFRVLEELDLKSQSKVVISSVVPHLNEFYLAFFKENSLAEIVLINPAKQDFLKINTDNPEQLGPDLYINALMAHQIFPKNNTVVVDFGTALTFTVVSSQNELLGVSIVPGIKTAIKALFDNAAMLPEVKLMKPSSVIGTDTVTAIQSGIVYGYEGLLQNIMSKLLIELGPETKFIATGGLSVFADMFSVKFDLVNKNLTLEGLNYYSELSYGGV